LIYPEPDHSQVLLFAPSIPFQSLVVAQAIPSLDALFYIWLHCTFHALQAFTAILVLCESTSVTYSIASVLKRVVVILAAVLWFGFNSNGITKWIGVFVTLAGLWMYDRAKHEVEGGERQVEKMVRQGDVLLPFTRNYG